jgi:hypothetical protein
LAVERLLAEGHFIGASSRARFFFFLIKAIGGRWEQCSYCGGQREQCLARENTSLSVLAQKPIVKVPICAGLLNRQ